MLEKYPNRAVQEWPWLADMCWIVRELNLAPWNPYMGHLAVKGTDLQHPFFLSRSSLLNDAVLTNKVSYSNKND
jgi:hypothetical protein